MIKKGQFTEHKSNNTLHPETSADMVIMADGSTVEYKMNNHKHDLLNKTTFEGGGSVISIKPASVYGACFMDFFADKENRSAYIGYGNSGSPEFRIYNRIFDADINIITSGVGVLRTNGKVIYHEGNKPTAEDIGASPSNHTHNEATATECGFMSASDKAKLDGIEENANNYKHPTNSGSKHIPVGGMAGQILKYGGADGTAVWSFPTEIVDNLDSTDGTKCLSANQGNILNTKVTLLEQQVVELQKQVDQLTNSGTTTS